MPGTVCSFYKPVMSGVSARFDFYFVRGEKFVHLILSEGALTGVAEAIRLAAKLPGLWREASPSAVADSMESRIVMMLWLYQ